jgi:hypothetical protein
MNELVENVLFDNITIDGSIISQSGGSGGLIGQVSSYYEVPTYFQVSNITNNSILSSSIDSGGIFGRNYSYITGTISLNNVVNNGDILITNGSYGSCSYFGGIAGEFYSKGTLYMTNVVNNGNIYGATDTLSGGDVGGIIGYLGVKDGEFASLINNGNITFNNSTSYVAGLIGYGYASNSLKIENSYNIGNVNSGSYIAGIIGEASGGTITISRCYNKGIINGSYSVAGILSFGDTNISIINCYNAGNITANGSGYVGGIVGQVAYDVSKIENTYNSGKISNTSSFGASGIVYYGNNCELKNNYNLGTISASSESGGIAHYISNSSIENNYNSGTISGNSNIGGILAFYSNDTFKNNYYLKDTALSAIGYSDTNDNPDISGEYESIENMPSVLSIINGDGAFMNDIYGVNNGYPVLSFEYDIEEYEKNNDVTSEKCFSFSNGTITGYNENCGTNVVIPSKINGVDVTEIGNNAFYLSNIESVTLPTTLNIIGTGAFAGSTLSGTVVIPKNVTIIKSGAFSNTSITGLDLNSAINLVTIESSAFYISNSLTGEIKIPKKVVSIGQAAFASTNITSVDLSNADSLTGIQAGTFNSCSNLTGTIKIPKNVITIESGGFSGVAITGLDLSGADSLTTISAGSFANISTLTGKIIIPKKVVTIDSGAFANTGITGLDFSNASSLTTINGGVFSGCSGISTIDLTGATSLTTLSSGAFASITSLETIKLNSTTSLDSGSISGSPVSKIIAGRSHDNIIDTSSLSSSASTIVVEYNDGYCTNDNNANFYAC